MRGMMCVAATLTVATSMAGAQGKGVPITLRVSLQAAAGQELEVAHYLVTALIAGGGSKTGITLRAFVKTIEWKGR